MMNDFFKVLADETRLRCLVMIFEHEELCVCELIHALALPQSKISRHLGIIKLNGLIKQRREGQWMLYSINPDISAFKKKIIDLCLSEQQNNALFKDDKKRLLTMKNRPALHEVENV